MNDRELKENKPEPSKQQYNAPQLVTYGNVEELTRGTTGTLRSDASSVPFDVAGPSH